MTKLRKIFFPAMLIVLIFGLGACRSATDQPDRMLPETRMDSISYIIGYDYGEGIKNQQIDADPLMIYKGVYDALVKQQSIFDDSTQARLVRAFQKDIENMEAKQFQEMLAENKKKGSAFLRANRELEGVQELPSGLQYKILKIGKGDMPSPTDSVTIHYRAMYIDRTTFDMSYDSGPVGIRLNHVVKGLSEGIQMMRPGAIYEFYIPPQLAYGEDGYDDLIPPHATLIFEIELIRIVD